MANYFDRYSKFTLNGEIDILPYISISLRPSDDYVEWVMGDTTFDKLSELYYGNSVMGWLINLANPEHIDEYQIEDGTLIRIPLPFSEVEQEYNTKAQLFLDS